MWRFPRCGGFPLDDLRDEATSPLMLEDGPAASPLVLEDGEDLEATSHPAEPERVAAPSRDGAEFVRAGSEIRRRRTTWLRDEPEPEEIGFESEISESSSEPQRKPRQPQVPPIKLAVIHKTSSASKVAEPVVDPAKVGPAKERHAVPTSRPSTSQPAKPSTRRLDSRVRHTEPNARPSKAPKGGRAKASAAPKESDEFVPEVVAREGPRPPRPRANPKVVTGPAPKIGTGLRPKPSRQSGE